MPVHAAATGAFSHFADMPRIDRERIRDAGRGRSISASEDLIASGNTRSAHIVRTEQRAQNDGTATHAHRARTALLARPRAGVREAPGGLWAERYGAPCKG